MWNICGKLTEIQRNQSNFNRSLKIDQYHPETTPKNNSM